MNREETRRAAQLLSSSPAAGWIGNKFVGSTLLQRCMRCGAEQLFEMPPPTVAAFHAGARGDALASTVPHDLDERLFAWKHAFQLAHEDCVESAA